MQPSRFNVRCYGILLNNNQLLLSKELIKGEEYIKFPGGGLLLGEGTLEALHREFIEELDIEISVVQHFYTTDFYVPSVFDNSQIISVYYIIKTNEIEKINSVIAATTDYAQTPNDQLFEWVSLADDIAPTMSLPIDKIVVELLKNKSNYRS